MYLQDSDSVIAGKCVQSVYSVSETSNSEWIWGKDEVTGASNHLLHSAFTEPLLGFYGHLSARQAAFGIHLTKEPELNF